MKLATCPPLTLLADLRAKSAAVLAGELRPGSRLPSSRCLATDPHLSCNTVELAFAPSEAEGKLAMTVVAPRPEVVFGGERPPSAAEIAAPHHRAHAERFLANSVHTEARCEPAELSHRP